MTNTNTDITDSEVPAWACLACRDLEAQQQAEWLTAPCPRHRPTLTNEDWQAIGSAIEDWDPAEGWNDLSNNVGSVVQDILVRHLAAERKRVVDEEVER